MKTPATTNELLAWLLGPALAGWSRMVTPADGIGFVEQLDLAGQPVVLPVRQTLSTARLVYAFSHLAMLGGGSVALAHARRGFAYLTRHLEDREAGGFFASVDVAGTPVDRRKDAYDMAFVLFASAWLHRATAETAPLEVADRTIAFMDAALADPVHGGYREAVLPDATEALPRRQNPHMHLLEAFHALFAATGKEHWRTRAIDLVALCEHRFVDRHAGSLGEFFTADWLPAPGDRGRLREPGHHYEWTWLLHQHARLTGDREALTLADQLFDFAERHGLDGAPGQLRAAFDEIDRHGTPVTTSKLLWPQTEALKACIARWERRGDSASRVAALGHLTTIFEHYLGAEPGIWHNRLDRAGTPIAPVLPLRVLYHLVLALAEAVRVDLLGHAQA